MTNIKPTETTQSAQILSEHDQPVIDQHPLAKAMGKFEGELWEATLAEVQQFRDQDRKELEATLKTTDDE
ncbi:MAG: hypothetical protein KME35_00170 [Aphanocapsa sp. GSE-SYN-MK-11-07L]|jgi:hypothetical protein|nr:hypothetical protein [Aphanocapsa sp. GSE-SYN-MK-11-07L]